MKFDRKVTIGFIAAVLVQTGGALVWAGAAAERISTLEDTVRERRSVVERLARLEEGVERMEAQLERIERRLEAGDE
jgi:phage shock protein A